MRGESFIWERLSKVRRVGFFIPTTVSRMREMFSRGRSSLGERYSKER